MLLRRATLADGSVADVRVRDGVVVEVGDLDGDGLDLSGHLLLGAAAEPHAHLDKALTASVIDDPRAGLMGAVGAWTAWSLGLTEADVVDRGLRVLRELLAHGVTAVRTHANLTDGPDPLVAVRALVALRAMVADTVTLQVVVLPRPGSSDAVIAEGLAFGADLVGGAPHSTDDPAGVQKRLLDLARAHGVGVDLHTDEHLEPGRAVLLDLAEDVITSPLPVTASHCVALGCSSLEVSAAVAAAVAEAGISVVTLPQTNLWLQGHGSYDPPRGLTAVRALLDTGAVLAAGADNVRDPFNPVGRCDPFETASLLVSAGQVTVEEAWTAVSASARTALGLAPAGPFVGGVADLLAVRASSLQDAVARAPEERIVLRAGRVVARTTVTSELAILQEALAEHGLSLG